jgi:H+/Cl- antiporter ClcA
MWLLRAVQHAAWRYQEGDFLQAVLHTAPLYRVLVLLGAGIAAGLAAYLFAMRPGGHAGEATAAMWFSDGRLPFVRTLSRGVLSIFLVGMGASLGREAAPKQTGAAIGSLLGHWLRLSPTECRLLVASGTGAGMGAVYNVPFGGALFGIEVLLGTLKLPLLPPVLLCSLVATCVSRFWLPDERVYTAPATHFLHPSQLVWAALAGPVAGFLSVFYVRAISWADSRKPHGRWWLLILPVVTFASLGALAVLFPQILGNGKDLVQLTFVGNGAPALLVCLLILKPLATVACLGTGAPGGLFTPTMTVGAVLGILLGHGWNLVWPGPPLGTYAVLGSAAVLAAATQGPISSLVLVLELTGRLDASMIPMMLAIGGAVLTARAMEPRSIYSGRIHTGRGAAEVHGDDTISAAAGYPEVLQKILLRGDPHRPLFVLNEHGERTGYIIPAALSDPRNLPPLLEIATAGDLAKTAGQTPPSLSLSG